MMKGVIKHYGRHEFAALHVSETTKKQRVHFHVCFLFFDRENLPFFPSRMEQDFRADIFKRWNRINGEKSVHQGNKLESREFNMVTTAYCVKTFEIRRNKPKRPKILFWGIWGKKTLLRHTQPVAKQRLKEEFKRLFCKPRRRTVNLGSATDIPKRKWNGEPYRDPVHQEWFSPSTPLVPIKPLQPDHLPDRDLDRSVEF
jgi:hypothetical protein